MEIVLVLEGYSIFYIILVAQSISDFLWLILSHSNYCRLVEPSHPCVEGVTQFPRQPFVIILWKIFLANYFLKSRLHQRYTKGSGKCFWICLESFLNIFRNNSFTNWHIKACSLVQSFSVVKSIEKDLQSLNIKKLFKSNPFKKCFSSEKFQVTKLVKTNW